MDGVLVDVLNALFDRLVILSDSVFQTLAALFALRQLNLNSGRFAAELAFDFVDFIGFVTQLLAQRLDEAPCDVIYACGPKPMLRLTAAEAEKRGIRCMVSLEERMGCGVGACLVCACKTRTPEGGEKYLHVCKNGPVFDSREVIWE